MVLAGFDGSSSSWTFGGKGSGGMEKMLENIPDNFIGYGFLRVNIDLLCPSKVVLYLFKYVSSSAQFLAKARLTSKRGEIEQMLNHSNYNFEATSKKELQEKINMNLETRE